MPTLSCLPPPYDDNDVERLLEQSDAYIYASVQRLVSRHVGYSQTLIDEIAQDVRTALWRQLQKRRITALRTYIDCTAYSRFIDLMRKHKRTVQLSLDQVDECWQNSFFREASGVVYMDPASEIERKEWLKEQIDIIIEGVPRLPPQQRRAIVWHLRKQLYDLLPLVDAAWKERGFDSEKVIEPGPEEIPKIRASLSVAQKKLREMRDKNQLEE